MKSKILKPKEMKTEKKLIALINEKMNTTNENQLILVLSMVVTLNKDNKLNDLTKIIQEKFPEYGQIFD